MGTFLTGYSSGKTIEDGGSPVVPNTTISCGVGGDERGEAVNGNVPQPEPVKPVESTVVDLGLSVKWAAGNVGATSPEDYGLYFAWGETTGFTAEQVKKGVRKFDEDSYKASAISDDLTLEQDAAHTYMGGKWRMPTYDECQELIDNCSVVWTENYNGTGVAGRLFTSRVNGNSVFFPAAGGCYDSFVSNVGSNGHFWSASWRSPYLAWLFDSGGQCVYSSDRYCGRSVRGVLPPPPAESTPVDLGLPSGLKWAAGNVGAKKTKDYGLYFAWGETTGYTDEQVILRVRKFDKVSYKTSSISSNLTPAQDAAHVNLGGNWRMPTKAEFQELIDNCDVTWVSNYMGNNVSGRLFTSKINGNSVFFPAAGFCKDSSVKDFGSFGGYWSASWSWYSYSGAWDLEFTSWIQGLGTGDGESGLQVRGVLPPPAEREPVDMGLPSGTLWAAGNVGATSPEQAGLYFAWGETVGFTAADVTAGERAFDSGSYTASAISDDLTLEQDAAHVNLSGNWRMPTADYYQELIDNCIYSFHSNYRGTGVTCAVFKSMVNGNELVIPCTGYYNGKNKLSSYDAYCWSSSWSSSSKAKTGAGSYAFTATFTSNRYYGMNVRAIVPGARTPGSGSGTGTEKSYKYIDLGLPSGTLWATCNVGATSPEDYGLYFAWGETTGYSAEQVPGVRGFTQDEYNAGPADSISANLTLEQDAAHIHMGGKWRMPTYYECQELIDNCDVTWLSSYMGKGVAGKLYTSRVNGNSVFLPAAGYCSYSSVSTVGSFGNYWSASWSSSSRAWDLDFNSGYQNVNNYLSRYYGYSVRGVCE